MSDSATVLSRPLPFRMRPDLEVSQQTWRDRIVHVLKDPLTLQYFQLREEEFALLTLLDGKTSIADLKQTFESRFAPHTIDVRRLQSLFRQFHRDGLLLVDNVGQGEQLWERAGRFRRRSALSAVSNVLAIRLRGVDPSWFLDRAFPLLRPLLNRTTVIAGVLVMLSAAILFAAHFEEVLRRLPAQRAFFSATNFFWIAASMAFAKVLHELGHAFTLKRFGGECHEIGVMFLVFTPCLYCNVTDAWTLTGKWQRIAVSLAGIYVELLLAAVSAFLWWHTQPGLFNTLCFNLMVVGAVSSLLFNGNPLLRYDGYFVLSDLIEEPNLWSSSRRKLRGWMLSVFAGVDSDDTIDEYSAVRSAGLLLYAVASTIYRVVVLVAIFLLLRKLLESRHLETLAVLLAGSVGLGAMAVQTRRAGAALRDPLWRGRLRRRRLLLTGAGLIAILGVLVFWPVPYYVESPVVLDLRSPQRVYVRAAATLETSVRAGAAVRPGDLLVELKSDELDRQISQLSAEQDQLRARVETLTTLRGEQPDAETRLAMARKNLASVSQRLSERRDDRSGLTVRSRREGVVYAPPARDASPAVAGTLPEWSGSPLDERNQGAYLAPQTLVCLVGDPRDWEARMYVRQADVSLLRVGQTVKIKTRHEPTRVLTGVIEAIAEVDERVAPRELLLRKDIVIGDDGTSEGALVERPYQARIRVQVDQVRPTLGASGVAKVRVDSRSVAWRFERWLRQTIRFN